MKKISFKKKMILVLICLLIIENQLQKAAAEEKNIYMYYASGNMVLDTKKGEMFTGNITWKNKEEWNKIIEKYKGKCKLNQKQSLKQISAHNLNELQVSAARYGAAIEPISGNHIEISYVGADDKSKVKVSTSKVNQKLTVHIEGDEKHSFYINPSENTRANTIKIGIPKNLLKKITIDGDTGSTIVSKTGAVINGKSKNGIIIVKENTASKIITMETKNGIVRVGGNQINGKVSLKAANGTAILEADTVKGTVKMETKNGTVSLKAGSLSKSQLKTINGVVSAKVGKLTGNTKASVRNGVLKFELTKKPENLKLVLLGASNKWLSGSWKLPSGWKNGHIVGNGKPVLTLEAATNGVLNFKTAK